MFTFWLTRVYPPSPWSSGISRLGENCEVIYGAQSVAGKILSRKGLALAGSFLRIPLPPWLVSALAIISRKD